MPSPISAEDRADPENERIREDHEGNRRRLRAEAMKQRNRRINQRRNCVHGGDLPHPGPRIGEPHKSEERRDGGRKPRRDVERPQSSGDLLGISLGAVSNVGEQTHAAYVLL